MGLYFNLSSEEKEFAKKKSFFCIIIYDIVSNKRRLKLAKLLEGFGIRVQRSCFEVDLEKSNYRSLLSELQAFYDADQLDNIIVYVGNREETLRLNTDEVEIERRIVCSFDMKTLTKYGILIVVSNRLYLVLVIGLHTRYGV